MQELDLEAALQDSTAEPAVLRRLPEATSAGGRAGVLGFCLGGNVAYHVATRPKPHLAVCYGSAIADRLDTAAVIWLPEAGALRRRRSLHPARPGG